MSEETARKIGEGHVAAMGRMGLGELRGALYPESNVAQHSEYGLYGTLTPGEVAEARRGGESHELDHDGGSILDNRLAQAAARDHRDDSRGPELDR
jgi:hypothetical protein